MSRLSLPLLTFLLFLMVGCAGHSTRHASNRARIERCTSAPCGAQVVYSDMVINYTIVREVSGEYVFSGTAMPRGVAPTTKVDLAVISIELVRDITIFESYSFPMVGRDLTQPLRFKKRFTPSGGFDGITLNYDVRYL